MKKLLIAGAAVVTLSLSFVSCSHEVGEYNASTDLQQRYEDAFIELFGQPDPEQNWGFGPKTSTANVRTRTENANANEWADPNKAYGGLKVPPPLTDAQIAVVKEYFQTVKNPQYQDPHWTNYFIQQVYKGGTDPGTNSTEKYMAADGQTYIVGSAHMDHLAAINGSFVDHINNFNHGDCSSNSSVLDNGGNANDGPFHTDKIMYMKESTTASFGYYNSNGSVRRTEYTGLVSYQTIINKLGTKANCLNDGWNRSFMGFDFEQMVDDEIYAKIGYGDNANDWAYYNYNGQQYHYLNSDMNMYCGDLKEYNNPPSDDELAKLIANKYLPVSGSADKKWVKVGGCADGYYSDWIVTLTEAKANTEEEVDFHADIRIIAEDLTISEPINGKVVETDFDFNDVVFDVMFNDDGTAWVQLIAAGGTLPLVIGGTDDLTGKEVHDLFGVPRNKMVNTNAKTGTSRSYPKPFKVSGTSKSDWGKNIPVYVQKNGVWTQLTANQGQPAAKVGVDPTFDYCDERVPIENDYPEFPNWVKDSSVKWY